MDICGPWLHAVEVMPLEQKLLLGGALAAALVMKVLEGQLKERRRAKRVAERATPRASGRDLESVYEHRLLGMIDGAELERPIPQYIFPAEGHQYRLDFAYLDLKLAIEVDGAWHQTASRKEWDADRDAALMRQGWSTLRFTTKELDRDARAVLASLRNAGVPGATRVT